MRFMIGRCIQIFASCQLSVYIHKQLQRASARDGRTNGRDAVEASGSVPIETD